MEKKPKIIVIVGPTATGKSGLAVHTAKKFNGEIISADSRQVYKGLDIGTGKITEKEMGEVPHYLLNVVNPKKTFTVTQYKKLASKALGQILEKNKLPIICGGTGFYIRTLVDDLDIPEVLPNLTLRKRLEKKTSFELFNMLKVLDPIRAKTIDKDNPRRLIRAIEIAKKIGHVPPLTYPIKNTRYTSFFIGLDFPDAVLKAKIKKRLEERIGEGMIQEAKKLHREGLSYRRMEELGLEYKFLAGYLKGNISKNEMITELQTAIWHYAKRQRTWFRKDKRITWFIPSKAIDQEIKKFLKL